MRRVPELCKIEFKKVVYKTEFKIWGVKIKNISFKWLFLEKDIELEKVTKMHGSFYLKVEG